ncbi:MAG: metallophosphoesterase [Lachnospiraceae bacterium]|jgi:putative phosphoesterase|nr:metallophosphoesterase [Lachnospiraceae bacterium]
MRILIASDTHRKNNNFLSIIEKQKPLDLLIHCGDAEGSEYALSKAADCPSHFVTGNNDFFSRLPQEVEIVLGEHKIMVAHGHTYGVMMGNERLKEEAKSRGADLVLYGHTHKPIIDRSDKRIIAVNPGSLSYPRQDNRKPSYIMMEIDEEDEYHFTIVYLS